MKTHGQNGAHHSGIVRVARDVTAHSMAGAIAALGHSLGLTVIAEGVETAAQRDAVEAWLDTLST